MYVRCRILWWTQQLRRPAATVPFIIPAGSCFILGSRTERVYNFLPKKKKKKIIVRFRFYCGILFFLRAFILRGINWPEVCECVWLCSNICTCVHVCLLASDLIVSVVIMFVCHLQINGQDVQDREEAMATLSNDECRNIVLLVARPEMQVRHDPTLALTYCIFWPLNETPTVGLSMLLTNYSPEGFSFTLYLLRVNLSSLGLPPPPLSTATTTPLGSHHWDTSSCFIFM